MKLKGLIATFMAVLVALLLGLVEGRTRQQPLQTIVCDANTFEAVRDPLVKEDTAEQSTDCYIGTFRGERVKVLILD
jgi:hypothetical protein